MKTSATNRRIRVLISDIRDTKLIPRPEFQRRLVWSNKHKTAFIETILLGLPFPEIYIAAGNVDPQSGAGTELLVDGQQRMTTIYQYFTASPELKLDAKVLPYAALEEGAQRAFLEYEVVIRDLGAVTIDQIRQVFQRINSTKYSLNAMEVHNARFEGELKAFGESVASREFFERHHVFKANEVRRMRDLSFALLLVISMKWGYSNREDELEEYLARFNDEFPFQAELSSRLDAVFKFIDESKLEDESRVWNKADLLTLVVEVDKALHVEPFKCSAASAGPRLRQFYKDVDADVPGRTKYAKAVRNYREAARTASADRGNRILRGEVIRLVLAGSVVPPKR